MARTHRDLRCNVVAERGHLRFGLRDESGQAAANRRAVRHAPEAQCVAQSFIARQQAMQLRVAEGARHHGADGEQQEREGGEVALFATLAWGGGGSR